MARQEVEKNSHTVKRFVTNAESQQNYMFCPLKFKSGFFARSGTAVKKKQLHLIVKTTLSLAEHYWPIKK